MSRIPLVAANIKMHALPSGAEDADSPYRSIENADVWIFPTFLDIHKCVEARLITGGQYGHTEPEGAHTGDINLQLLKEAGCVAVLCGHSERRQFHNETNEHVGIQARMALDVGLHPLICIGETDEQRQNGVTEAVLTQQLSTLPLDSDITIAYEPVWAIGTGKTATPQDAQAMHTYIRSQLPSDRQQQTRILYGGSVKPHNAADLFVQPDIDGGLIGGASLDLNAFRSIVEAASS